MTDVTGLREAAAMMDGFAQDIEQMADAAEAVGVDQALVGAVTDELTLSMTNARDYASPTVNRLWAAIGHVLAAQLPEPQPPPDPEPDPEPPPEGT